MHMPFRVTDMDIETPAYNAEPSPRVTAEALRRSERALRESETRFRAMADNIAQLAWMARPNGSIFWCNEPWHDYTGMALGALRGSGWRAVHHPDHMERVAKHYRASIAAGEPWEDTFPLRGADETYRWFLARARPILDERGQIELWFGTHTDVTEARAAEAVNAHLAAVVASLDDAIVTVAPGDGRVLTWNHGAERLFGYRASDVLGKTFRKLLPPDLAEDERDGVFSRVMAGCPVVAHETVRVGKDGDLIQVAITATRMSAPDGRAIGLLAVYDDLRPRLRAEAELREKEAQLRQAQKLEAIGRLAAGVAHDFNNILQTVMGGLELLLDEVGAGTPAQEYAELAMGSAKRGSTLTHQLLSYARKQMLRPQFVELAPFLSDIQKLLARTLGPHIVVEARAHGRTPPIHVDPSQLETALLNLAINASHAMPKGGTLLLDAQVDSAEHDRVVIAVTDTGIGMDEATVAQAFEPFFTTKGLEGTGLGLSMVEGFAEQSGGHASIASACGKGTTVMLWLPIAHQPSVPRVERDDHARLRGSGRILVVDDVADVLLTVSSFLQSAGFAVEQAAGSGQALSLLAAGERFDLMVSDYAMPDTNGVQLIEQARAIQIGLPALLITGYAEINEAEMLPDAVAVVRKPFQRRDLVSAVLSALPSPPHHLARHPTVQHTLPALASQHIGVVSAPP